MDGSLPLDCGLLSGFGNRSLDRAALNISAFNISQWPVECRRTEAESSPGAADNMFSDVLGVWVTGVFCLLGFAGNILSFIVLWRAFRRCPMFFVLRALAVSDAVFLCCVFFLQTVVNLYPNYKTRLFKWSFDYRAHIQAYMFPLMMTTQMTTVWTTVLVSGERYMAVCYPLRTATTSNLPKVRRAVLAIFTFSAVYNIPRYFEYQVGEDGEVARSSMAASAYYRYLYNSAMYSLFLFLAPLVILLVLNIRLVTVLRRGKRQWQSLQFRQKREQNMTVIPLTIVLVFFVCSTPALFVNVLDSISHHLLKEDTFINIMLVGNFLVVVNSASNFVIYCLVGRKFRTKLLELCRCRCHGDSYSVIHRLVSRPSQMTDF